MAVTRRIVASTASRTARKASSKGAWSAACNAVGLVLLLVLGAPAAVAQDNCPPEDCLPIVPFPDVSYLHGDVEFLGFAANVTVRDAIAMTALTLTVRNDGPTATEAVVSMPLPDGAAILGFNLTIGDRMLVGRVMERELARQEYNEAVEQGVDAALLEQADKRLVSLSLNVAPGEERVLRAAYAEALPLVAGTRIYRLPLSQLDPLPGELAVDIDVDSSLGASDLRAKGLAIALEAGKGHVAFAPTSAQDFVLSWDEDAGARSSLVAASPLADGPSEALATLCLEGSPLARDVVFILDQSGSMRGLKMEEGRQALVASLDTVTAQDRYSVIAFSSDAVPFGPALVAGTAASVEAAQAKAAKLVADGSTNLDAALQEAFRQLGASPSDRLPMVVLMTDGLPTEGVTDHDEIIERARAANTREAPIVVVPIGLDADYTFLAHLALRSGGAYVDPGTPDGLLSDRLARLAHVLANPVASDVVLAIDGADPTSIYPRVLPPVYADDCLEVRFRTTGSGPVTLRLQATGSDGALAFNQTFQPGSVAVLPAVRNLWGQALVADLLANERVQDSTGAWEADPAVTQAIIANATLYGLLSPYTSWILVDDAPTPTAEMQDSSTNAATGAGGGIATGTGAATGTTTGSSSYSLPGAQRDSVNVGVGTGASKESKTPGPALGLLVLALAALALVRRRT